MAKNNNEGYFMYTMRFPEEWRPIMEKATKLSDYRSLNAFFLSVIGRTPEVIKAWEMAGKPVLPALIRPQGNPNFIKSRKKQPTKGLWGRPLSDNDDGNPT